MEFDLKFMRVFYNLVAPSQYYIGAAAGKSAKTAIVDFNLSVLLEHDKFFKEMSQSVEQEIVWRDDFRTNELHCGISYKIIDKNIATLFVLKFGSGN